MKGREEKKESIIVRCEGEARLKVSKSDYLRANKLVWPDVCAGNCFSILDVFSRNRVKTVFCPIFSYIL